MADEQEEFGVKFAATTEAITDAKEAVQGLNESLEETNTAAQAVTESTQGFDKNVERLRDTIGFLKTRLIELADEYKKGTLDDEQYKDASDLVIKTLKEQETILNRVTAAEREKEKAIKEIVQAEAEHQQKIQDIIDAVDRENEAIKRAEDAQKAYKDSLLPVTMTAGTTADSLDLLAGEGDGESGKGGFKGVAGAAVKAEKAIGMLASGGGLGRLPGMLEGLTSALGLAGGAGLAAGGLILAFESIIPKVETFIEKMTGAAEASERAAKALKEHNEQVEKQRQAFEKIAQEPTREEKAGAAEIKTLLGEGRAGQIKAGIAGGLEAQKFGLTTGEEVGLQHAKKMVQAAQKSGDGSAGGFDVSYWVGEVKKLQDKRSQAIEEEANRWVNELPTNQRVQQAVEGMAAARPGAFPDYTQEMLFAARPENVRQAEIGRQRTTEGHEAAKGRDKAKEEIDESLKFAADWKVELDKQAMNETKAGFKDKVSELKSQLSDLGADLREKTISPQEYKAKADVLVDAIAAAIQGLAQLPGENVKAAHRDIEAAKRTVRSVFDRGVDAVKHVTDKALHDAKTVADKANRDKEKFDREHTPEALTRAEAAAQSSEIMGAEREQNQYRADMGAIPFDARELEEIKHKALQAMPMYKARGFSVGQLVADMMAMQANQIEQGIYDGLDRHGRSGQLINPRGGH